MRRRTRRAAALASAILLVPAAAPLALPAAARGALPALPASRPILALGAGGPEVKVVQQRLGVAADSRFGPATQRAVQALQAAAHLVVDGIVGSSTWAALERGRPTTRPPVGPVTVLSGMTSRPDLSQGASGPAVVDAQKLLTRAGRSTPTDGRFGPATFAAVVAFQRNKNLSADGVIGSRTWAALGAPVAISFSTPIQTTTPTNSPAASVDAAWRVFGSRTYTVARNDTWAKIASATGSTATALAAANRTRVATQPSAGAHIHVPGSWQCPVPGGSFSDDYGFPRSGGRTHQGNDLFDSRGTPIRAPAGGLVEHADNRLGGTSIQLHGDDGNRYYFAHLDRYGVAGQVRAGTVIGYVGNSGDAITTPTHLHFEIHPGGNGAVNPFPTLTLACRH